jgi:hypothetical protein
MNEPAYDWAANLLSDAEGLLITALAGMSVDSGLPAYRAPMAHRAYRTICADFASMTRQGGL